MAPRSTTRLRSWRCARATRSRATRAAWGSTSSPDGHAVEELIAGARARVADRAALEVVLADLRRAIDRAAALRGDSPAARRRARARRAPRRWPRSRALADALGACPAGCRRAHRARPPAGRAPAPDPAVAAVALPARHRAIDRDGGRPGAAEPRRPCMELLLVPRACTRCSRPRCPTSCGTRSRMASSRRPRASPPASPPPG